MQCAALCHAHGVELAPHQTQPTISHAANMRLMATVMQLAKPVEAADNRCRLNALFKNAPEPQNRAFPVPPDLGRGLDLEKLEPGIKPL
jgi:L-alanine-DL-glutamate epimerase-like enolase superfamily enzyme